MNRSIYKSESGKSKILKAYHEILQHWPVENQQFHVETTYGNTFIIDSGDKNLPALLLLHGSVSNSFAWIGDVEELTKAHRVIAVDLIGEAGFSAESRPAYDSGAYEQWLDEVIDALGLKSVALIGLSLGGWMALNYAVKMPQKVDQLVLLCPGGLYPERQSFLPKAIFYALTGKWGRRQLTKLLNGGFLPNEKNEGMAAAMGFTFLIGKHFKPRTSKLRIFTKDELKVLKMPVLLIFGDKDCLLNSKKSVEKLKASAKRLNYHLLKNTGHVITGQATSINDFLRSTR